MATKVLVAYASKHGTTSEVADSIAGTLQELGLAVEIKEAGRVHDVAPYDAVVIGGGLYMGKWHADARRMLKRHRQQLAGKRLAVFGMGPDSLDESKVAESRRQLERSLAATPELVPIAVAIFGGALEPELAVSVQPVARVRRARLGRDPGLGRGGCCEAHTHTGCGLATSPQCPDNEA